MNLDQYTERARAILQSAQTAALASGHQAFTPEHVLKAMLEDRDQLTTNLIRAAGGRPELVVQAVDTALGKLPRVTGGDGQLRLDQKGAQLFATAESGAKQAGDSYVTVERLLLALAATPGTPAAAALKDAGVTVKALEGAIAQLRQGRTADSATAEEGYDALKKYARDLTQDARDGKLDPVIGRDHAG